MPGAPQGSERSQGTCLGAELTSQGTCAVVDSQGPFSPQGPLPLAALPGRVVKSPSIWDPGPQSSLAPFCQAGGSVSLLCSQACPQPLLP